MFAFVTHVLAIDGKVHSDTSEGYRNTSEHAHSSLKSHCVNHGLGEEWESTRQSGTAEGIDSDDSCWLVAVRIRKVSHP